MPVYCKSFLPQFLWSVPYLEDGGKWWIYTKLHSGIKTRGITAMDIFKSILTSTKLLIKLVFSCGQCRNGNRKAMIVYWSALRIWYTCLWRRHELTNRRSRCVKWWLHLSGAILDLPPLVTHCYICVCRVWTPSRVHTSQMITRFVKKKLNFPVLS